MTVTKSSWDVNRSREDATVTKCSDGMRIGAEGM